MTPKLFAGMRKEAGLTQAKLAAYLGVSKRTIINWEDETYDIPEEAAAKLRELASAPKAATPVTPKSHPQFYEATGYKSMLRRNHKHPHWFVGCTLLQYHMEDAQIEALQATVTTTDDIEKLVWTPERAITFCMQFNRTAGRSTHMSRERAEEIARSVGFDVPKRLNSEAIKNAAYNAALAQWNVAHPDEPGWSNFENANPQWRENKPAAPEMCGPLFSDGKGL